MLIIPPPNQYPRKKTTEKPKPTAPPPPIAPVLVAATFDEGEGVLTMRFDRAIDLAGLAFDQILVNDAVIPVQWAGTGDYGQPDGPEMLSITLIENAEYSGDETTLSAAGGVGIVALDGGEAWAGVVDLALPFG